MSASLKGLILAAFALASTAGAQNLVPFKRPDCSAYATSAKPERKCVRETRASWSDMNKAALQKTGLMFVWMARPDLKANPEAVKARKNKVEGSFLIRFSVKPDGTVYDVQTVEVTEGIQPLAKMWVDTIRQWTFVKSSQPVTGIEYRQIYMYSKNDDDRDAGHPQHESQEDD